MLQSCFLLLTNRINFFNVLMLVIFQIYRSHLPATSPSLINFVLKHHAKHLKCVILRTDSSVESAQKACHILSRVSYLSYFYFFLSISRLFIVSAASELLAEDAGVDELGAAGVHGHGRAVVCDGSDTGARPLEGPQLAGHRQHACGRPVPKSARHLQLEDSATAEDEIVSACVARRCESNQLILIFNNCSINVRLIF